MSIHTRLAAAASAAVVAAALALPASAATSISLNSGQEPAGGEPGGHGFFSYTIDGTEFCWTLSWQGIATPLAGHVHFAPRGVAGPIVIDLDADDVVGPDASGCRVITAELARTSSPTPEPITSTCTTLAFRPAPSGGSSSSRRGLQLAARVDHLHRDLTAALMRSRSLACDIQRLTSASAVAAA